MIKVGKDYTLVMLDLTDAGYVKSSNDVTVTSRDGNLIEVNGCQVINTTSPLFHSLTDDQGRRATAIKAEEKLEEELSAAPA